MSTPPLPGGRSRVIPLAGDSLDVAAVAAIARGGARVELTPAARARVRAARAVIEHLAAEGRPVYGLTTGLGAHKDVRLAAEDLAEFQRRVVMARSVAIGPPFPTDVVRAMLAARINAMAAGGSGVQPAVLDTLVAMLNAGVHPVVPSRGSIGAADLAPLAHLSLPLIGLGEAEYAGERLAGAEAMQRAGLRPVTLGPKDGLALVSANAASAAHGALVLHDALDLMAAADVAAALSMEGFRANLSPLDARAQAAHPAPGQREAAARLSALLAGSALWEPGGPRFAQDPLSFRCASQVHGAALAALDFAKRSVEVELNAAGDNPLVLAEDGVVLHTGNFHTAGLAQSFDLVGIALAHLASAAAGRVIRLMSPGSSGLPAFLTPRGPTRTGFAAVQKPLTALVAEIRHLANPASLDFLPVSEGVEDHATMAPLAVRHVGDIVERLRTVLAIEVMAGAQAIDLGHDRRLGARCRAAHAAVRAVVPALDEDRVIGPDIETVERLVACGGLLAAACARARA